MIRNGRTATAQNGSQAIWLGSADKPASIAAAQDAGGAYIAWGPFVQTTIDFMIIAFAIFMMIKVMNKAQSLAAGDATAADEAPPPPAEDIQLLREIRDSLAK